MMGKQKGSQVQLPAQGKELGVWIMVHPAKPEGGCHRQRLKPLAFEWALNCPACESFPKRTRGIIDQEQAFFIRPLGLFEREGFPLHFSFKDHTCGAF